MEIRIKKILTFSACYLLCTALTLPLIASTSQLPPVGSRVYLIQKDGGVAPVAILRDRGVDAFGPLKVLRDPWQQSPKKDRPKRSERLSPSKTRVQIAQEKAALLRFKKMKIPGKTSIPRAEFEQNRLELRRADEPIERDFFERIFLPVERDDY